MFRVGYKPLNLTCLSAYIHQKRVHSVFSRYIQCNNRCSMFRARFYLIGWLRACLYINNLIQNENDCNKRAYVLYKTANTGRRFRVRFAYWEYDFRLMFIIRYSLQLGAICSMWNRSKKTNNFFKYRQRSHVQLWFVTNNGHPITDRLMYA